MSFNFSRITLNSWLVYEGVVTLDFGDPVADHNIHVIYGMNGFGKTSLLRAIQWVFHNEMPDRHIKDCFNEQGLARGNTELSVAVEFQYNGLSYHLIRRAVARIDAQRRSTGYPRVEVELSVNHQLKRSSVEDTIAQILPRECQQFFFFDGLEIEKYARQASDQDMLDAIERVLGVPEVRNLEVDLGKLATDLGKERDRLLRDQEQYNQLREKRADMDEELAAAQETLDNLRKKRDHLNQLIETLEARAARLDSVRDKQNRLRDLTRHNADLSQRLDNYDSELRKKVNVVTRHMVLPLLKQRQVALDTQLNKAERTASRLSNMKARRDLIEEILSQQACICGQDVDSKMKTHLTQQLEDLQAETEGAQRSQERTGSIREASSERANLEALISGIEREETPETIQRALLTKYKLSIEREEATQEIAALEKELEGHEDDDVRDVYVMLAERRQERGSLEEQIKGAEQDVAEAKHRLDDLEQQLNTAGLKLPGENILIPTLQSTQAARKVAQDLVDELVRVRRREIEQHLTTVFRLITNKKQEYDRIELSADYVPRIVSNSGRVIESDRLSAGEKEVLAFAFIAGLNLSIEAGAPLVMDTPFGHLDVRHREGLIQALPKLPCQVILLATDRDIPFDDLPNLKPWLGGRFDILRDQVEERSYIQKG